MEHNPSSARTPKTGLLAVLSNLLPLHGDGAAARRIVAAASLTACMGVLLAGGVATASAAEPCPNQVLREENNSTALPGCRAYEMVTPLAKGGANVQRGPGFGFTGVSAISASGDSVVVMSPAIWATPDSEPPSTVKSFEAEYELARGPSGWTASSEGPPVSAQLPRASVELLSPGDVSRSIYSGTAATQPRTAVDLYLRQAGGSFDLIGPANPPAVTAGAPLLESDPNGLGSPIVSIQASSDLSHVVFSLHAPIEKQDNEQYLWPGDGTVFGGTYQSLYEYVGLGHSGEGADLPSLVGVDNDASQISTCGSNLGNPSTSSAVASPGTVSAQGSTVFFTAAAGGCESRGTGLVGAGPAVNQLYARIGSPGETQATVNLAGSAGCTASDSCDVIAPTSYQGAAEDGSRAFFTTTQALPVSAGPADADATNDIYECELPGDSGATPAPSGDVNPCPDLRPVTVTGTAAGAEVEDVAGISADGSHVYYIAKGVLTGEPNVYGATATAGVNNLYVATQAAGGSWSSAFIGSLAAAGLSSTAVGRTAQITPDGRYLAFLEKADLTPDDTSTVNQLFRYDADSGELVRISQGQEGFGSDGNTTTDPANFGFTISGTSISEDGSYIAFESAAALTPQVNGALNNVYLWHQGEVDLISDGIDTNTGAALLGISATGADLFFTTTSQLAPADRDQSLDIYDARVDGGFPAPVPTSTCEGEACHGAGAAPPAASSPATTTFSGPGNPTPPMQPACSKGKVRQLGRCVKKHKKTHRKHHRAKHKRTANTDRGGKK